MVKSIDEVELLRAFHEAYGRQEQEGYLTTAEWEERLGWGKEKTQRYLGKLKLVGKIIVGNKEIVALNDTLRIVPAYKLVQDTPLEEEMSH
jgi:hypothetical protein